MTARRPALLVATLLAGLTAGFFFTYEVSVTRALAEVDDATYVVTFQAINDTIRHAAFGIVFFGTIPAIAVAFVMHRGSRRTVRWLIAGSLVAAIVCLVITAGGNVPLNDDLAGYTELVGDAAATARADFEADWNRLNLIRFLFALVGFALVASAAVVAGDTPDRHRGRSGSGAHLGAGANEAEITAPASG